MKNLFTNFKGDLLGGLTAGIVALPLALAFGVSSGLGPSAGLYGAIFLSFFAAFFGGTPTQISGPTAPMTAVSMVVIGTLIAANDGDIAKALPIILMVFMLAGLFQIGLGLIGLGKYIRYIPYPVVSGFMTAIGLIILITQILPSVGYYPKDDTAYINQFKPEAEAIILSSILEDEAKEGLLVLENFEETIIRGNQITEANIMEEASVLAAKSAGGVIGSINVLPNAIKNINLIELILALGTIFIIYGFKRITTAIPSTLVSLLVMSGVAILFFPDYRPISAIPNGFPLPQWSVFSTFSLGSIMPYIFTALTLALLGAIDSLLTSVVADNMTKTKHNPNKELVGQGIGNSISALFGGLPGAGATIRTVVNINSGGKTRLSGMVAGLVLLTILLGFSSVASKIPAAVLAGILITVGIGVMDYKGLKAIPNLPRDIKLGPLSISSEALIMVIVLLLATFWNLVYAVGIGLVIASLMFMKKIGDLTGTQSKVNLLSQEKLWKDELNFDELKETEIAVKHVEGPLFFGSTSQFQQLAKQLPKEVKKVIIRLDRMNYIDQSGLYVLEDLVVDLNQQGIEVYFISLSEQPRYMMERIGLVPKLITEKNIFNSINDCLESISILKK